MSTSWDDGHALDLRLADLLTKYNLNATFYIPRHTPRGVLTDEQIRRLSASFEIGAHTIHHHRLPELTPEQSAQEITASKSWIEDLTSKPCPLFCPPGGQFHKTHLDQISHAGFSAIRTTELMSVDFPRPFSPSSPSPGTPGEGQGEGPGFLIPNAPVPPHPHFLIMPTTLQSRPQPAADCLRNFIKRRAPRNAFLYLRHSFARPWTTAARRLLHHTLTHGGVFHLWGHSWEIHQHNQWTELEEIFRVMSDLTPDMPCLTNSHICQQTQPTPATATSPAL